VGFFLFLLTTHLYGVLLYRIKQLWSKKPFYLDKCAHTHTHTHTHHFWLKSRCLTGLFIWERDRFHWKANLNAGFWTFLGLQELITCSPFNPVNLGLNESGFTLHGIERLGWRPKSVGSLSSSFHSLPLSTLAFSAFFTPSYYCMAIKALICYI
jgi:hypothetical protein